MAEIATLAPRAAFAGLLSAVGPIPAGVSARARDDLTLAFVAAGNGRSGEFAARCESLFGFEPPSGPRRARGVDGQWLGIGPGRWLAIGERTDFVSGLARDLDRVAAVVDQSDGLALIEIAGPKARRALEKGLPIDLDASVFPFNAVAASAIAHVGVTIWRAGEGGDDEAPRFVIAISRSLAGSFARWLMESAAEFGLSVEG
jgi:sarcosine oxidase subunit gamma